MAKTRERVMTAEENRLRELVRATYRLDSTLGSLRRRVAKIDPSLGSELEAICETLQPVSEFICESAKQCGQAADAEARQAWLVQRGLLAVPGPVDSGPVELSDAAKVILEIAGDSWPDHTSVYAMLDDERLADLDMATINREVEILQKLGKLKPKRGSNASFVLVRKVY